MVAAAVGVVHANPLLDEVRSPTLPQALEFAGTGDDFFSLELAGPAVARLSHAGSANFIVLAYDSSGNRSALVNHIGSYAGDRPLGFEDNLPVEIELRASGDWTLTVLPLSRATVGAASMTGRGDAVINIADVPGRALTLEHDGSMNFIVLRHGEGRRQALVNHIGAYSGRVRLPDGSSFLEIRADGTWTLQFE